VGYVKSENDVGDMEDTAIAYAVNYEITLTPGVYIVPEFIFQDNQDKQDRIAATPDLDKGDETIIGMFWRIDFK
jgi:hypothetical protein